MQLVTTSCFLNSESSHSLAIVSWSVFRVCERAQAFVCCGLTQTEVACMFAMNNHSSSLLSAVHLYELQVRSNVPGKNAQITVVFLCVCAAKQMCERDGCVYGAMVQWNKMNAPFFFRVACVQMLCLYQETDAPSTTPTSCFNLPARLHNVRRAAFTMISASLFSASSMIGSAAWTSHRLLTEIPHSCLCWGPCRKLSFKSAIKRNTCTPVVYIMCVSLSQGDCRALICLCRLWGWLL